MKVFISYARNDLDGGELESFLKELDTDLKSKLGEKARVLFQDLKDFRLGDEWEPKLEEALRTSSIMLAICSPSFIPSEYCDKEFTAFLDRLTRARAATPGANYRAIFPIVWTPAPNVPANIERFQFD